MQYRCVVVSDTGEESERVITAENEEMLCRSFQGTSLILIRYSEIRVQKYKIRNHITNELVLQFTESLSALLSSGLSIQDSLSVCAATSGKKRLAWLCEELQRIILEGGRFYNALSLFAPSFSPLYIALVRIGEMTGSVQKVFSRLTAYLKRKREVKQKILQSLTYPVMVCITAVAIIFFILIFVLPRIRIIFEVFNTEAGIEQLGGSFDRFTNSLWYIFGAIGIIVLLVIFAALLRSYSPSFALSIDGLLLRVPVAGAALKTFYTSDFAFSMEMLCSAGIPFMQALEKSKEVVPNTAFRKALENSINDIAEGKPITQAFKTQKVFPDYITTWIGIGEQTGSVENAFSQIHSYFEHESNQIVSNVVATAQPVFILIAGIIVILLIWRLVLPIFSLIGGI
ncbi:type II secretion system F family protein [Brucepastera parasyntrophica]|uniref:type II secretion system F family protein n=1 Tax=Brucepastera parasyntrophica TaxID=2880008 RepID=UPI00210C7890|nr:type II secretion system F family protein [Brucepastera parasyntrophica]ULQ59029.1 type II secretion system F family protein [Brucepastera parasyntrophica]